MDVPSATVNGFQKMAVRLPIKIERMGMRNLEFLWCAAFIGSVEQCIPDIRTSTGLYPALVQSFGGDTSFGRAMSSDTRWQVLIRSGCRLGQEFRQAWEALRGEALLCSEWLGEELGGSLGQPVEGVGEGCVTGSTRKMVVEQMDKIWGSVLKKGLESHPDRRARPVMSWPERDKLSSAWLLALPTGDTALSSPVFAEAAAAMLCLHSPACEVFNLFTHLIPQEGLSRMDRGRKRQGLVPDFMMEVAGERRQGREG